jgi:hypothetical protein
MNPNINGRWGTSDNFNGLGDIGVALGEGWKIDHLAHFPSQTDPPLLPALGVGGDGGRFRLECDIIWAINFLAKRLRGFLPVLKDKPPAPRLE